MSRSTMPVPCRMVCASTRTVTPSRTVPPGDHVGVDGSAPGRSPSAGTRGRWTVGIRAAESQFVASACPFTIGMTYQVSDTNLSARLVRSRALQQGLLSSVVGMAVLELTVSTVISRASWRRGTSYCVGVASLLVVEDDESIGGTLTSVLTGSGYDVVWCRNGREALLAADRQLFDLVLLDLGLPDADGVDVCRSLRLRLPTAVVVMLTARTEEMDVVIGLESGADDYLTKPIRLGELMARLRAHLRRVLPSGMGASIRLGELVVDTAARRVFVGDREIPLRAKEFDLLVRLTVSAGAAVSREALMADVWDANWFGSTKTLDVHVAALRRKLGAAASAGVMPEITTLRGVGYRLELP